MKYFELFLIGFLLVGSLTFVQILHTAKHNAYCKTEAEWLRALPTDIKNQLKDR